MAKQMKKLIIILILSSGCNKVEYRQYRALTDHCRPQAWYDNHVLHCLDQQCKDKLQDDLEDWYKGDWRQVENCREQTKINKNDTK